MTAGILGCSRKFKKSAWIYIFIVVRIVANFPRSYPPQADSKESKCKETSEARVFEIKPVLLSPTRTFTAFTCKNLQEHL